MDRPRRSLLILGLGLAAALGLASCGESDSAALLPGNTAGEISSNLDEVRRLSDEGECVGAQDAALAVSDQIDALGGVDKRLKQALREGATRLNEVVAACQEEEAEEEVETEPSLSTEPVEVETEEGEKSGKKEKSEPPGQEKKAEKEVEATEETETAPPTTPGPAETPPSDGGTPSGGVAAGTPAEEK